jgi:hypothetical protein
MGQFSMEISCPRGSVLGGNQQLGALEQLSLSAEICQQNMYQAEIGIF